MQRRHSKTRTVMEEFFIVSEDDILIKDIHNFIHLALLTHHQTASLHVVQDVAPVVIAAFQTSLLASLSNQPK